MGIYVSRQLKHGTFGFERNLVGAVTGPMATVSGVAQNYNPLDEGNCKLWFDAQDPANYTLAAGALSAFNNKATAVSWSQATAGSRPAFSASGINGHPCFDFDGVDDHILSTEATVFPCLQASQANTVYCVVKADVPNSNQAIFAAGVATGTVGRNINWRGLINTGGGVWCASRQNNAGTYVTANSAGLADSNVNVLGWTYSGGLLSLYKNNAITPDPNGVAWSTATTNPTECAIGGIPTVGTLIDAYDGKIGEILVFAALHNAAAVARVSAFLLAKWA